MQSSKKAVSRAERRKMIRRIDRALLDLYPEHTKLVKWWRKLDKSVQEELRTDKDPPENYRKLVELDKAVVSLLGDRRRLKGESKNPNGIESTIRGHGD